MKLFLFIFLILPAGPQKKSSFTGDEILRNVEKGVEDVQDFVVTIEGDINMERLKVPRTKATMYYKKPDKVHFDSQSFAMIPRDGIMLNPLTLRQRYSALIVSEDSLHARRMFKLQLVSKDLKTRLRQMFLWIDPANWTIARAASAPYEGRMLTFDFTYSLQAGKFWMPSSLHVTFDVGVPEASQARTETPDPTKPMIDEMQRTPRKGSITITYSDYRINTNLSDETFRPQEAK